MNKTELITEIINLADKAERYDELITIKATQTTQPKQESGKEGLSDIDRTVLNIGKQRVVDGVIRYWKEVVVRTDEETGERIIQSYENWLKKKVDEVPDYISRKEFLIYFDKELREVYEEELEKALDRFEEEGK